MAVTMICPNLNCGRTVLAADEARGKAVRCAHCQQLFLVPTHQEQQPAQPEEGESEKEGGGL